MLRNVSGVAVCWFPSQCSSTKHLKLYPVCLVGICLDAEYVDLLKQSR